MPTIREYNHNTTNKGREVAQDIAIRQLIEEQNVLVQQLKEMSQLFSQMVDTLTNAVQVQHSMGERMNDFNRRVGLAAIGESGGSDT